MSIGQADAIPGGWGSLGLSGHKKERRCWHLLPINPATNEGYGTVNGRRPSDGKRPVGVVTVEGCERKR